MTNPDPTPDDSCKIKSLGDVSDIFKNVIMSDLNDLESSLRAKQNKIIQLEDKLIKKKAMIMDLTNENSSLKEKIDSLVELQSQTSVEEFKKLDVIERDLDASRQNNESLTLEIEELKKKLQQAATAKCKETMMEREKHRGRIEELESEKRQLLSELAEKKSQLTTERRKKEELKSLIGNEFEKVNSVSAEKDARINQLQIDLDHELKLKSVFQERYTLKQKELDNKSKEIMELKIVKDECLRRSQKLEEKSELIEKLKSDNDKHLKCIQDLEQSEEELKNKVLSKEFDIAALAMEKNKMEVDNLTIENLRARNIELEHEKQVSNEKMIVLTDKLLTFKQNRDHLELAHSECDADKDKSENIIKELKEMNGEIGEELKESQNMIKELEHEKQVFHEKMIGFKNMLQLKEEDMSDLSKTFAELQTKCGELTESLARANNELGTLSDSKILLESKLLERENEITKQEEEHGAALSIKDEEIRKLLEKGTSKESEINSLIENVTKLKEELTDQKKSTEIFIKKYENIKIISKDLDSEKKKYKQIEMDRWKLIDEKKCTEDKFSKLKQTFLEHSEKMEAQNKNLLEEKRKLKEVSKKIWASSKDELMKKEKEIIILKEQLSQIIQNQAKVVHEVQDYADENCKIQVEEEDKVSEEEETKNESCSAPVDLNLSSFDENITILSSFVNEHKDNENKVKEEQNSAEEETASENIEDLMPEKRDDGVSSSLLAKIEQTTNQFKSEREMLNYKEQIKGICRKSKQLFSTNIYEAVERKIVDHYSKGPVMDITDTLKLKITNLLVKISKKYTQ